MAFVLRFEILRGLLYAPTALIGIPDAFSGVAAPFAPRRRGSSG
jgi:hypothetical protein